MKRQTMPSITFTALIWLGMILVVLGAVVAVLGIGGSVDFSATVNGNELKTTNLGLAILAIGAILAAFVATRLPKGVQVFAVAKTTWRDRVAANATWFIIFAFAAVVLLAISLLKR